MNFAVVTFTVDLQHWPKSYLLNLDSAFTLTPLTPHPHPLFIMKIIF
jgi:hypothetical protein